jgi:hypothetical protein
MNGRYGHIIGSHNWLLILIQQSQFLLTYNIWSSFFDLHINRIQLCSSFISLWFSSPLVTYYYFTSLYLQSIQQTFIFFIKVYFTVWTLKHNRWFNLNLRSLVINDHDPWTWNHIIPSFTNYNGQYSPTCDINDIQGFLYLTSMTTLFPTISPLVIDGNTHAPPIIMILISIPLWHQWKRLGMLPLSLMEKCNSLLWGCSP